jgi:hypothetical protein
MQGDAWNELHEEEWAVQYAPESNAQIAGTAGMTA